MRLGNRIKSGIALLGLLVPLLAASPAQATPQGPTNEYVIATSQESHAGVVSALRASGGVVLNESPDSGLILASITADLAETLDNFSDTTVGINRTYQISGSTYKPTNPSLDRIDQRTYPGDEKYSFADKQMGAGVNIYIVDSGVQGKHSQFNDRVKPGISFVNTVATGGHDRGDNDCNGHGTHVAGIAAGETTGVAPKATIIPVQVFGCATDAPAETYRIVLAINWIVEHHKSGTPAVVNMSIGGSSDPVMTEAIDELVADGVTVVVAAGNDTKDACSFSPANAPSAITVGAMSSGQERDSVSYFSNYGSCVDIFAPGGDFDATTRRPVNQIMSANSAVLAPTVGDPQGDLLGMVGTSQAAPFVAGAAARYLSFHPSASAEEVTQVLLSTSTPDVFTDSKGSPNRLLYVDPNGYTQTPTNVPNIPVGVDATYISDASVAVSWKSATPAPTVKPTPKPTAPEVKPTPSPTQSTKSITCYKDSLTKVVKGVNPKCSYGWTTKKPISITCLRGKLVKVVKGFNPKCPSGWVVRKSSVTPTPTPSVKTSSVVQPVAPIAVVETATPVVNEIEVEPTVDAAATAPKAVVTGYTVTGTAKGATTVVALADANATTLRIEGLDAGRVYRFTVTANSATGDSAKSVPTNPVYVGTPVAQPSKDLPGAPTGLSVSPGNNTAQLNWSDPVTDGGSPILMYLVEVTPSVGVSEFTIQETAKKVNSFFFRGLNSGVEYTFKVRALTAAGTGPISNAAKVIPTGQYIEMPAAPSSLRVKYNKGYLGVQWAESPPPQGGRYVTGWQVNLIDSSTGESVERLDVRLGSRPSVDFSSAKIGQSYKIAMTAISRPLIGNTYTSDAFTMSKTLSEGNVAQFDPVNPNPIYVAGLGVNLGVLKVANDVTVSWSPKAGQEVSKYYISWQEFGKGSDPWSERVVLKSSETSYTIKGLTKGDWMVRIENVTADGTGVVLLRVSKPD
jgi:hypothetical protein